MHCLNVLSLTSATLIIIIVSSTYVAPDFTEKKSGAQELHFLWQPFWPMQPTEGALNLTKLQVLVSTRVGRPQQFHQQLTW